MHENEKMGRYLALSLLGLLAAGVVQVLTLRCLQADGVAFLVNILKNRTFESWDYARQFSQYITQMPLVAALVVADVRDVRLLTYLWGAGLYGVSVVSFAATCWVVPSTHRVFLLLLAIAYAAFALTTSFFVISESGAASALFLFLMTFLALALPHREPTFAQWLAVAMAALASLRAYEFFAILGPILSVMTWLHIRRWGWPKAAVGRAVLVWIGCCGVVAAGIALYFMFFWPTRSVHNVSFGLIVRDLAAQPSMWICAGVVLVAAACAVWPPRAWGGGLIEVGAAILGLALGVLPWFFPATLCPSNVQYDARVIHVLVPVLLTFVMLLLQHRQQVPPGGALGVFLVFMLVWNLTWQISAGALWMNYLDRVEEVVQSSHGTVEVEHSLLKDDPFVWSWTMPALSIITAGIAGKDVPAIILPLGGDVYETFDVHRVEAYPDLTHYGIQYRMSALPR